VARKTAGEPEKGDSRSGWAVHYDNRTVYDSQKVFARSMRNAPTAAEVVLWQALRGKAIDGYKFRRQHVIGRYIAHFYCAEARLVIEVDGDIHEAQKQDDAVRDAHMAEIGLTVLRFSNAQVSEHLPDVVRAIREALPHP
jgi:very-short-patch-repair endonuclease